VNFNNIHNVYFIGIGGIGMSAIARYFNYIGKNVAGYDKTASELTNKLQEEGIDIHFEDNIDCVPDIFKNLEEIKNTLIIYTPAIPSNQSELSYFTEKKFNIKKRSVILGEISTQYKTIAVAGTHGKTTTSSLIAHILKEAGINIIAFLGGVTQNYNSNLILDNNAEWLIAEADEFDKSFLTLHPEIAVITSLDADHLDIYENAENMQKTYCQFALNVKEKLIVKKEIAEKINIPSAITYSIKKSDSNYFGNEICIKDANYFFNLNYKKQFIKNIAVGLPGIHNVENAVAASAVCFEAGVDILSIKKGISTFNGVKRRFEYHIKSENLILIDDYAHHPEELKNCILSVKELYPTKKITGIFQPHLYSRTRDFSVEFANSLDLLDELFLLDIYPARELPIEGVNSEMLLKLMQNQKKQLITKEKLVQEIALKNIEVLLIMGAGDIDRLVEPIKKALLQK
jgi:UDP-N-acetylmuramate--alanine ligase